MAVCLVMSIHGPWAFRIRRVGAGFSIAIVADSSHISVVLAFVAFASPLHFLTTTTLPYCGFDPR